MTRIFGPAWNYATQKGELNFQGAVKLYFEEINKEWEETTKNDYFNLYINQIFRYINQNKPISDFDELYINSILQRIKEDKELDDSTIDSTYKHLIVDPYLMYFDKEKHIKHEAWGRSFKFNYDKYNTFESALFIIPKSLFPEIDAKANRLLSSDYKCVGERVGLKLMYSVGGRENEICAVNYRNIKPFKLFPGLYYLELGFGATSIGSNTLKTLGKTANSPRRIPLLQEETDYFLNRRKWIESKVNENIDDYPIACVGQNFKKRCKTQNLCNYGRDFFKNELKLRSNDFAGISQEMYSNSRSVSEFNEEEPTTYIFRRNFATKLYLQDFAKPEREFLMGHGINSEERERYDYADENVLYLLYQKRTKPLFWH